MRISDWSSDVCSSDLAVNLDVATSVLGGLASSRLDNELVKKQQLAVAVSAGLQAFEKVGLVEVYADVKPGVDPAVAGRALDRQIEKLLKEGPTADEVRRVATGQVASRIAGLGKVGGFGGKAVALAEGALYANDPEFYKRQLARYAAAHPAGSDERRVGNARVSTCHSRWALYHTEKTNRTNYDLDVTGKTRTHN